MTSPHVDRAWRKFANRNADRIRAVVPTGRLLIATVSSLSPLTVTWRGGDVEAAGCLNNYTPAVGDRVECGLIDGQLVVHDKIRTT